ncbi:hypothetical protein J7U46_13770 [Pelomonas sp. V22]|nr:hypothetical protein [Pelomonas sp. V22]
MINDLLRSQGQMQRAGTVVYATLTAAPKSTKNADGERPPETKQRKKVRQWYFGMTAQMGGMAGVSTPAKPCDWRTQSTRY